MKTNYRGFEIDVHKDRCQAGYVLAYYSVFTAGGFEVTSGFSEDETRVQTQVKWWKKYVDDLLLNPRDYVDDHAVWCLSQEGLIAEEFGHPYDDAGGFYE